jgi:hypothetical protein
LGISRPVKKPKLSWEAEGQFFGMRFVLVPFSLRVKENELAPKAKRF